MCFLLTCFNIVLLYERSYMDTKDFIRDLAQQPGIVNELIYLNIMDIFYELFMEVFQLILALVVQADSLVIFKKFFVYFRTSYFSKLMLIEFL